MKRVEVEMAVSVDHKGPGNPEDTGVSRERALGQLGQLAIIAGWQIITDLTYLGLDQMIIVE